MRKRGSLSLSVNAIVVFILAFSMLGVGLFLINQIRTNMAEGTTGAFDINELRNPPTSDRPLVVPETVSVKIGGKVNQDIGFYANKEPVQNIFFEILDCNDGGTLVPPALQPKIIGGGLNVDLGEAKGFKVLISTERDDNGLQVGNTYVCKLRACSGGSCSGTGNPIETATFYLSVHS
ncbi:MAG: hypothetical protein KKG59_02275 [Nanoarchaeota archaeon]|nr:hypothetical protein [Nanoarchaeota archaeon]